MKFDLKFSIIDMMRDRLHAAPFQPFVVVLHSGERLRVKNPDTLTVTLSGWVIYDDGTKARMLNPALSHQRLCRREGSEVDPVAAAAGEFLVEDVGEVGAVGGDEVAREAAVLPHEGEVQVFGALGVIHGDAHVVVFEDDAVDGCAGGFAEFAGDGGAVGGGEGDVAGRGDGAAFPPEERGEPAEEEQGGGAGAGGVAERDAAQGADACGAVGRVVHLRDGLAEVGGADPVQVAEHGAAGGEGAAVHGERGAHGGELCARVFPRAAVEDEAVHPAPDFGVHLLGAFAAPPEGEGQVVVELREDEVRQKFAHFSLHGEGDLLAAHVLRAGLREVAVRIHPRLHGGLGGVGINADEERVEGVVAHEAFEQFGAVLHRGLAFADDGEIDERCARARLVGLPELLQLAGDGGEFDGGAEGGVSAQHS